MTVTYNRYTITGWLLETMRYIRIEVLLTTTIVDRASFN